MPKTPAPRKARNDILLIAALATFAILSLLLLKTRPASAQTARVLVDGSPVLTIPLTESREYPLNTGYGRVLIAVQNAQIRILASDCPDQLCVRQGPLVPSAPPLCCLPNHLIIEYAAPADGAPYDILIGGRP